MSRRRDKKTFSHINDSALEKIYFWFLLLRRSSARDWRFLRGTVVVGTGSSSALRFLLSRGFVGMATGSGGREEGRDGLSLRDS